MVAGQYLTHQNQMIALGVLAACTALKGGQCIVEQRHALRIRMPGHTGKAVHTPARELQRQFLVVAGQHMDGIVAGLCKGREAACVLGELTQRIAEIAFSESRLALSSCSRSRNRHNSAIRKEEQSCKYAGHGRRCHTDANAANVANPNCNAAFPVTCVYLGADMQCAHCPATTWQGKTIS